MANNPSFLERCDSMKETVCIKTAKQIKELMDQRHMSVEEMAQMTGINTHRMKDMLVKQYEPMPVWAIFRCALVLGMEVHINLTERKKK